MLRLHLHADCDMRANNGHDANELLHRELMTKHCVRLKLEKYRTSELQKSYMTLYGVFLLGRKHGMILGMTTAELLPESFSFCPRCTGASRSFRGA